MGRRKDWGAADRAEKYRAAKYGEGWRVVSVLLAPDAVAALDALAKASGEAKAQVVTRLLRTALDQLAAEDVL